MKNNQINAFININKPSGITSHDVISRLRRITGVKQIGHAGTLDPAASGVLPIAIGRAARLIDYLPSDKRYTASLIFGRRSDTYDTDGNIEILGAPPASLEQIKNVLPVFTGKIKQLPPAYSAVHYNGKRLYELARAGRIPDDIPSRTVEIYKIDILDFDEKNQILKLDISCSKGTYIRSLINDLGETLNTGAVMSSLERTNSAGMDIQSALKLDNLELQEVMKNLINPLDILPLKRYILSETEYNRVLHGNKIFDRFRGGSIKTNVLLVYNDILTALAVSENGVIQPKRLL